MNPETLKEPLAAATAAARRLLVQAIDIRFGLDEAVEAAAEGSVLLHADLRRLRIATAELQETIDRLELALQSSVHRRDMVYEEDQEEVAVRGH
jgi:hypothetical protein